jgi:hypothetical protein
LFLEFLIFLIELFKLLVGLSDGLLSGLHFFNEGGVILFGLKENVVKFGVGRLELSGLLFELLQSVNGVIQKFVKSFAFVFVFGSLFFELF